ncbi:MULTISPECIES: 5-formyltetrahydrofolate cyclo-ligase [Romboutsia]|uniref:5-formyltetrahydrofolate cyclo-ligase n=1 Tax=Romboutsia hominis TaxID=1507512 RepID=A0A2P2BMI9_9FIRM|nr:MULTISPECIES: 5-formyltetrahydrofolate cyclo-ligase [Romboutsia]MCH1958695.1 5-formyltetrahydrofolate cyclo-ligase [Romboutsia hominis]MDB8789929.1 5-formyltetrahydrofolate cyclo-ligase [Romboutsia sp. 1001216sp1]MDB8794322.1 5-formyltetrahydrofolate cyclo-ligase [Romboutsia sp. 1001216sp1]MDB8797273.1 5-formyltetrahydrofolate cyclo-ligase [Romboutsia sp. 1001216sp1]MDB8800149.1 5-formyltetrahydrofolate cyclo-ligase [Romboutsia sp. 1001216sp1]
MKKEFRKKVISDRNNQNYESLCKNSSIITQKILALDCIKKAKNIMLYLDFNNEVKTDELIVKLLSLGKTVSSPITIKEEKKLIPSQIIDLKDGVKIGAYGIREPKPECSPEVEVKDIDVVIVPAVAYDKDCYRLGYGGGFYDRFIERLREDAITVGIAFDLQIFDSVPKEDHDAQLDYIITESQILTPNKF